MPRKRPPKSAPTPQRRKAAATRASTPRRKVLTMELLRQLGAIPAAPRDRTPIPAIASSKKLRQSAK